jgi:ketosteroid isomerase-like protein
MSQENVEIVRQAVEHLNRTAEPTWELHAPDVQYRNLPDAPWQPSPGFDGVREWYAFANDVAHEWRLEIDEYRDLGPDQVLTIGRLWMRFRETGIEGAQPMAILTTLRDGKFTRLEAYHTPEQALEAVRLAG